MEIEIRSSDISIDEHKHKSTPADERQWLQNGGKPEFITEKYHGLLITATFVAAMTFHAAIRSPAIFSHSQVEQHQMSHIFILFNSVAFFASMTTIALLAYHLPVKPWLWIVSFSTIAAYFCVVMVVSPNEVGIVILAGTCILIAALLKYLLALDHFVAHQMARVLARIQVMHT